MSRKETVGGAQLSRLSFPPYHGTPLDVAKEMTHIQPLVLPGVANLPAKGRFAIVNFDSNKRISDSSQVVEYEITIPICCRGFTRSEAEIIDSGMPASEPLIQLVCRKFVDDKKKRCLC